MAAIVVHGGAGRWDAADRTLAVAGVARAAAVAWGVLAAGGSALDAVVEAVVSLEDDPLFNAGTGSVLNSRGEVEMDASVMAGDTLAAGGVACIERVRNPVLVARRVLQATDCVLLAGSAASAFAREQGFADYDPGLPRAVRAGQRGGTVGAVALDDAWRLAAATSTGGREGKRPGRVGDSPIPGAGNYAAAHAAVSATGWGEQVLRYVTAKDVADRIARGAAPEEALREALDDMARRFGEPIGAIALDARGRLGVVHGTAAMPHGWRRSGEPGVTARFAAVKIPA
ncbi:MAG: isoaspartyl peptidase/L-asparaginase family protein [Betaproteobacteria bacterium]|nr:isoaspartyl peptidase/L-asparaginase family protein [Betaproteobacteria bacterium]